MVFNTDYRTERFALDLKWEDLPKEIKERAIACGIDIMNALILGSYGKQFAAGEKLARTVGLKGDIPVVGSDYRYNLLGASIALGHSSNSFDIDDGHRMIQGHPCTSFIGGVMAAAAEKNITYREYLTTLVACYELTIRWALAMQKDYGFLHSTGAYGAFGTALGIARILGLDEKQLNNALSIADYHAPMTPVMRAVEFPSMNKDGVPFGALVGSMAVLETLSGSTGRTHILEMPEYKEHLDDLGKVWHIMELYFKPYTCCRWTHQPIQAIRDLMKEYAFTNEDVELVKVHTFLSAARLSKIEPKNTDEAQYNIAFPVASALVFGDVGLAQIRDEACSNPVVLDMMKRLEFVVDPELDSQFPAKRLAWVEIALKSGQTIKSKVYEAPGEMDDPDLCYDWFVSKFKRITKLTMDEEKQDQLIDLMTNHPEMKMRDFIEVVNNSLKKNI